MTWRNKPVDSRRKVDALVRHLFRAAYGR